MKPQDHPDTPLRTLRFIVAFFVAWLAPQAGGQTNQILPLFSVPVVRITIHSAPGTLWADATPFTVVITGNDMLGEYGFNGSNGGPERGAPLFSGQVFPGSVFYAADAVTGLPARSGGPGVNRPGRSSFIAANLDPATGEFIFWANAGAGAVITNQGFDWEYQLRYFGGLSGRSPARLEIGTVPNVGDWSAPDELTDYTVEVDWQISLPELPKTTGYGARERIKEFRPEARRDSLFADPVDTATGAQVIRYSFLLQHGARSFDLEVLFHSLVRDIGPLGQGWSHGYSHRIDPDGADLILSGPLGTAHRFQPDDAGGFTNPAPASAGYRISPVVGGGWRHTLPDAGHELFSADGRLAERVSSDGQKLLLSYDDAGRLHRVSEPVSQRFLDFTYDHESRLTKVVDTAGREVSFQHDGHLLVAIDRTVRDTPEGVHRARAGFVYDLADRLVMGTGSDLAPDGAESGKIAVFKNQYDFFGRIVVQAGYGVPSPEIGSGHEAATFSYREDPDTGELVTIAQHHHWNTVIVPSSEFDVIIADGRWNADPFAGTSNNDIFFHDAAGRLKKVQFNRGGQIVGSRTWTHDAAGFVSSLTNPDGTSLAFTRDAAGRVLTETVPGLGTRTWTYDADGRVLSLEDRAGARWTWEYDAQGRLTKETDPEDAEVAYARDAAGLVTTLSPPAGGDLSLTYEAGLPATITDALDRVTRLVHDDAGRLVETEHPDGVVVREQLDHLGHVLRRERNDHFEGSWTYDYREPHRPLLVAHTDRAGREKTWRYGEPGERLALASSYTERPVSRPLLWSEDAISRVLFDTDSRFGFIKRIVSDWTESTDSGSVNGIGYDSVSSWFISHPTHTEAPAEHTPSVTALGKGDGLTVSAYQLPLRSITYDEKGRPTQSKSVNAHFRPLFERGFLAYDDFNRPVRLQASSSVVARAMEYDAESRLTRVSKGEATETEFERDRLGRPVLVRHRGLDASRELAPDGLPLRLVGPGAATTALEYDPARQLSAIVWPDGGRTRFEHDARGRVTKTTLPSLKTIEQGHDSFGRLVSLKDGDGKTVFAYSTEGSLQSVTRDDQTIAAAFDLRDRLVSWTDIHGDTFSFAWNKQNLLRSITYPDGAVVEYHYGSHLGLEKIVCAAWDLLIVFPANYTASNNVSVGAYEAPQNGRAIRYSEEFPPLPGTFERFESWTEHLLRQSTEETIFGFPLTVDHFKTAVGRSGIEPEPLHWNLTGAARPLGADWSFPPAVSYTKAADGRLTHVDGAALGYDSDGNLVDDSARPGGLGALAWDAQGRLASAGGVSYAYDPLGRLASWTVGGETTRFSSVPVDGTPRILAMTAPSGASTYFVHGPDGLLAEYSPDTGARYYHFDPAGNALALFPRRGELVATRVYEPFGQILAATGDWSSPFGFRGREGLPTAPNGLVHMNARHYAPALRSFVSADPVLPRIEVPASFDRYAFAFNDPTTYTDPSGLAPDTGDLLAHEIFAKLFDPLDRGYGYVNLIKGEARVRGADGTERLLKVGDLVFGGETVLTGENGRVRLNIQNLGATDSVVLGRATELLLRKPSTPAERERYDREQRERRRNEPAPRGSGRDVFEIPTGWIAPAVGVRG